MYSTVCWSFALLYGDSEQSVAQDKQHPSQLCRTDDGTRSIPRRYPTLVSKIRVEHASRATPCVTKDQSPGQCDLRDFVFVYKQYME